VARSGKQLHDVCGWYAVRRLRLPDIAEIEALF